MIRKFLYLIIYKALLVGVLCGCERLDIPDPNAGVDNDEDVTTTPLPDMGEDDVRDGSREAPYTVAQVQTIGEEYAEVHDVWVEGYIVGWISGSHYPNGARFSSLSAGYTNLLLADSIFENDPSCCIPIELPNNSNVRRELNLQDNPSNYLRHIKLKGNIMTYFNHTGLKKASVYEWMGSSAMEDEKIALSIVELNENFNRFKPGDSLVLKNWTFQSFFYKPCWEIMGDSLKRYISICHTDTFSNRPYEHWLITPPINLDRMKNPVFSFETAYENWDGKGRLDVFIINEKNDESLYEGVLPFLNATIATPQTSEPTQWIPSGDVCLCSYSSVQYIGFRYKGTSTGRNGTSFRIDNIRLEDRD